MRTVGDVVKDCAKQARYPATVVNDQAAIELTAPLVSAPVRIYRWQLGKRQSNAAAINCECPGGSETGLSSWAPITAGTVLRSGRFSAGNALHHLGARDQPARCHGNGPAGALSSLTRIAFNVALRSRRGTCSANFNMSCDSRRPMRPTRSGDRRALQQRWRGLPEHRATRIRTGRRQCQLKKARSRRLWSRYHSANGLCCRRLGVLVPLVHSGPVAH